MNERSPDRITILGKTTFRNEGKLFGIRQTDLLSHLYLVGRTGTGKSTLLRSICLQFAQRGNGFALLDPHGDLATEVARELPEARRDELIYFDAPSRSNSISFNPLARIPAAKCSLAAAGMLEVFKKLWPDSWGPRTEHLLRNVLHVLLEQPEPSLADALRLLNDAAYRKRAAERVANEQVRGFWLKEFEGYTARLRAEAVAPLQNKIGALLTDPLLKRTLTQSRSSLDLRAIMDGGRILLVNLSKGRFGDDSSSLLGSLLLSQIGFTALSRAEVPEDQRRPFFVVADEFQSFATISLAGLLSELRKYATGFVLSHQYMGQLDERVRDAIVANVGSMIVFRVGVDDAEVLEKEFGPEFRARDLVELPNHDIYVRLLIDGVKSRPFSGNTLRPTGDHLAWCFYNPK